jgi:hypothetical protein
VKDVAIIIPGRRTSMRASRRDTSRLTEIVDSVQQ